jgi:hypothetical protein
LLGGSKHKNNIWTRGFAIAFVFAVAVFETQNRSPEKTLNFVTFSEFLTHPRVHHSGDTPGSKTHFLQPAVDQSCLDKIAPFYLPHAATHQTTQLLPLLDCIAQGNTSTSNPIPSLLPCSLPPSLNSLQWTLWPPALQLLFELHRHVPAKMKSEEAENRLRTSKGEPVAVWSSKVCKLGEENEDLGKWLTTGMN